MKLSVTVVLGLARTREPAWGCVSSSWTSSIGLVSTSRAGLSFEDQPVGVRSILYRSEKSAIVVHR
jgi:hypothetical protein